MISKLNSLSFATLCGSLLLCSSLFAGNIGESSNTKNRVKSMFMKDLAKVYEAQLESSIKRYNKFRKNPANLVKSIKDKRLQKDLKAYLSKNKGKLNLLSVKEKNGIITIWDGSNKARVSPANLLANAKIEFNAKEYDYDFKGSFKEQQKQFSVIWKKAGRKISFNFFDLVINQAVAGDGELNARNMFLSIILVSSSGQTKEEQKLEKGKTGDNFRKMIKKAKEFNQSCENSIDDLENGMDTLGYSSGMDYDLKPSDRYDDIEATKGIYEKYYNKEKNIYGRHYSKDGGDSIKTIEMGSIIAKDQIAQRKLKNGLVEEIKAPVNPNAGKIKKLKEELAKIEKKINIENAKYKKAKSSYMNLSMGQSDEKNKLAAQRNAASDKESSLKSEKKKLNKKIVALGGNKKEKIIRGESQNSIKRRKEALKLRALKKRALESVTDKEIKEFYVQEFKEYKTNEGIIYKSYMDGVKKDRKGRKGKKVNKMFNDEESQTSLTKLSGLLNRFESGDRDVDSDQLVENFSVAWKDGDSCKSFMKSLGGVFSSARRYYNQASGGLTEASKQSLCDELSQLEQCLADRSDILSSVNEERKNWVADEKTGNSRNPAQRKWKRKSSDK